MNMLVCYEIGTSAGLISGDSVYRNVKKLTPSFLEEIRASLRKQVLAEASFEIKDVRQIKNLVFRSITKLAD